MALKVVLVAAGTPYNNRRTLRRFGSEGDVFSDQHIPEMLHLS